MSDINGVFTRYVGRFFAVRFVALLTFFVIVLQMLDLLNKSELITAPAGAAADSLVRYVFLRAPQIISQFTPFAALLAIVVTLSALNLTSEIVVMRASGMSIHRVLFPIGAVCGAIAIGHFIFNETVTVPNAAKLAYWEANDYALGLEEDGASSRTNVRLNHESEIIGAASAARIAGGAVLKDVVIYALDERGLATGVTEAERAVFTDGRWRLFAVRELGAAALAERQTPSRPWRTTLDPELLFALTLDPDRASLSALTRQIAELRRDGADLSAALTSFLSRFSKPMATLVMPLLGAIAGFGVSRQGNQLLRASAGALLGFGYFVAENLMLAVGKLGAAPPMLGAFLPFVLFIVIGFSILLAMEN